MIYLILVWLLWLLFKNVKRHCNRYPYLPPDQTENPIESEQAPDYFKQAEIDRLQAQKLEYMALLDCIEQEQADLQAEYRQSSVKRRSQISSKLTSLASRHAATNRILSGLDSKLEKLYNQ